MAILLYGCAGPLKYSYTPPVGYSPAVKAYPFALYIAPVQEGRQDMSSLKKIGDIKSTVLDIYGTELFLARRPALIIREALIEEFKHRGFKVLSRSEEKADYLLKTKLQAFSLEIASKDKIEIALYLEVLDAKSKKSLWSGRVETSESRYAGVSGDSRMTISRVISRSLAKVLKKALNETEETIKKASQGLSPLVEEGEKNTRENHLKAETKGILRITTEPQRAKIYLNSIYYGLSPQTLRLRPGIYDLTVQKDGFLDFKEKLSVDKERETEVIEKLRKKSLR